MLRHKGDTCGFLFRHFRPGIKRIIRHWNHAQSLFSVWYITHKDYISNLQRWKIKRHKLDQFEPLVGRWKFSTVFDTEIAHPQSSWVSWRRLHVLACERKRYRCAGKEQLGACGAFLPSYLPANTSRRVNYATLQTSCFWQRGPGSQCLLLLRLHVGPKCVTWSRKNTGMRL